MAICSYRGDTASEFWKWVKRKKCRRSIRIRIGVESNFGFLSLKLKRKLCILRSLIDECKANYAGEYGEWPPAFNWPKFETLLANYRFIRKLISTYFKELLCSLRQKNNVFSFSLRGHRNTTCASFIEQFQKRHLTRLKYSRWMLKFIHIFNTFLVTFAKYCFRVNDPGSIFSWNSKFAHFSMETEQLRP